MVMFTFLLVILTDFISNHIKIETLAAVQFPKKESTPQPFLALKAKVQ